jgi:hypothetical protein
VGMRMRIDRPSLSIRRPFRLVTATATIDVIRVSHTELRWTWHDGREFRWHLQRHWFTTPASWRVVSQENDYSGTLDSRPQRYMRFNQRVWHGDGNVFFQDRSICSGAVRNADNRRILFWRTKCSARAMSHEVACSNHVPESQVPVLLGFVISDFWDQGVN